MHWLLLLAVLSTSTSLKNGGSPSTLNRLAENALRKQLGSSGLVRVQTAPGQSKARGDFDYFNITLDGFSADRLMGLADRAEQSSNRNTSNRDSRDDDYYPLQNRNNLDTRNIDIGDLGDIFGKGTLGDVLGGVLGGGSGGRIGRIRLKATNFTFQGARYDSLDATLGEVKFDWLKALRGDFDVKSIQPGTLSLGLRADQAARLLSPRLPSVRDVKVRFSNGLAYIGGRANYVGVGVPFEVGGKLSVTQNQVRADNIRASISRLRIPSFVLNELTRGVNPLYDFDPKGRWPLAINLQTAGTTNNMLGLRGGIAWRGFNKNRRRDNSRRDESRTNEPRYEPDGRGDYENDSDDNDSSTRDRYPDDGDARDAENRREDRNTKPSTGDILGDIFGR